MRAVRSAPSSCSSSRTSGEKSSTVPSATTNFLMFPGTSRDAAGTAIVWALPCCGRLLPDRPHLKHRAYSESLPRRGPEDSIHLELTSLLEDDRGGFCSRTEVPIDRQLRTAGEVAIPIDLKQFLPSVLLPRAVDCAYLPPKVLVSSCICRWRQRKPPNLGNPFIEDGATFCYHTVPLLQPVDSHRSENWTGRKVRMGYSTVLVTGSLD